MSYTSFLAPVNVFFQACFCLYKPLSYSPPQAWTFIGQHRNMSVINSAAGVALSSVKRVVHFCSLSVAFILTHRSQSLTKSSWLVDHLGKCSMLPLFTVFVFDLEQFGYAS